MPKHHEKKPQHRGVGLQLIGNPDELINSLIADPEENEWAIDQVVNEGPDHKQVHSALLLKRMYKLVQAIEKNSGVAFSAQKGKEIISVKAEHELLIPVQLPLHAKQLNAAEIVEVLSHAPEHELTSFAVILQAIEWSIKTLDKQHKASI